MLTPINLDTHIKAFEKIRAEWLEILVKNPNHTEAAERIVSINHKLELLRILGMNS